MFVPARTRRRLVPFQKAGTHTVALTVTDSAGLSATVKQSLSVAKANVNVVGRAFFEVELINEAEESYKKGLEHFLAGDIDDADKHLSKALQIDERYAKAHLQMGVLRKMQGRKKEALEHFEKTIALDPYSDAGKEAKVHKKKMTESTSA